MLMDGYYPQHFYYAVAPLPTTPVSRLSGGDAIFPQIAVRVPVVFERGGVRTNAVLGLSPAQIDKSL